MFYSMHRLHRLDSFYRDHAKEAPLISEVFRDGTFGVANFVIDTKATKVKINITVTINSNVCFNLKRL